MEAVALFAPSASKAFAGRLASALDIPLSPLEEFVFDSSERILRPLERVHGLSVYVLQSLFGDALGSANDRLCALLLLIGALKDAGAKRVTACVPYLAYARQDKHTQDRDPVSTRYVAQLLEAVGVDRVLAMEVHNPAAFDNAFRCETIRLDATAAFVQHFVVDAAGHDYAVATPDIGGAKRARHFQELLQAALGRVVNFAFMDKTRNHGVVSGSLFAGDVAGRRVIIVDDLISSGTTVIRAVEACRKAGAVRVDVAATHASFSAEAVRLFGADKPDSIVVTDSIDLGEVFSAYLTTGLTVLALAAPVAEAIRRLEQCRS
jgi:ribose-phosphate pyrophosphokinase